jgi:hypothetical protein
MSKSNSFETELLLLLFNNTNIPNIGDVGGIRSSVTEGSLYIALHTADPGEGGTAATSEASYTGYARVGVTRNIAGWTISNNNVTNAADIVFGTATGGTPETVTHWSITKASSGTSVIVYKGALSSSLIINNNIAPRIIAGALNVNED